MFRVVVVDETFHILLQEEERLAEAERLLAEGIPKMPAGRLRRGDGGFNQPWSWHLAPDSVLFVEVCPALDARPSQVEANLDHWIDEVMFYCAAGGSLVARVR